MACEELPRKDWYSILGADPSASISDLKQKYQKLILMYHPDKQRTDVPAGTVEECIQKFIEIDQAWKILGNEETKKEYDLQRHEDDLSNMGPVDAQIHLEEMSWNEEGERNRDRHHRTASPFIECLLLLIPLYCHEVPMVEPGSSCWTKSCNLPHQPPHLPGT
ncbi:dnaJ homolog subfamily C member 24 isoform X2 [Erinaceus europaeus]|uniref:DnaJ homolog subfamily C member 24 isoform X2 n=1 Tax=Erinaceus europaeus TaxID=9365 RepID=A0ABM3W7S4_ERIEU|nr:dnaJ homolog subfamily C member 24 isoform X2 [Erinaceus europaeus]